MKNTYFTQLLSCFKAEVENYLFPNTHRITQKIKQVKIPNFLSETKEKCRVIFRKQTMKYVSPCTILSLGTHISHLKKKINRYI